MNPLLTGYLTSASLIMAIGAQNAYVLRTGLTGNHILPVVLFCVISDVLLMTFGVFGFGLLTGESRLLLQGLQYTGGTFLLCYALYSVKRAIYGGAVLVTAALKPESPRLAILTIATLTYLNPHVYLDTILLIGGASHQYALPERWWFWTGAAFASSLWFFALGYGAKILGPMFAKQLAWRILDTAIACMMTIIGINLLLHP
jgi:L-lysine exporter family protein LysE/ArgO